MTDKPSNKEQETAEVPVDADETTTGETTDETTADDAAEPTESDETSVAEDESDSDSAEESADGAADESAAAESGSSTFGRIVAFALLPALALLLAAAAGFLKWQDDSVRTAEVAAIESTQVAKDSTVKMLSYKPDTVEQDLGSAQDLLTGGFKESYASLINDTVIPGAKEQKISAVASVPAVASISADADRAEALVFVNQTVIIGDGAPTATASSVKVTLEKVGDRWLISGFDPV
ncbi:hypothetical protein [Mycobacterium sp. ACS4331]|uniref:hypothetical protein n=1 Tax=Mycobacterium sp. ACS4331 TaxID=1834121 RepID=UPI0007FDD82B|nr:hypothetical protein [Mycobacterium sp. ACS4331]OBF30123.1 hypothetical protein A5727_22405 [Mycobacterium sp. ACS4331]